MISKFLMREQVEKIDRVQAEVTRKYLHFNINVSDLYPVNEDNKKIITIEFGDMNETTMNDEVVVEGGKTQRFSFELPPLQNPDDIYGFVAILHAGINNTLSELFKRKE